MHHDRSSNEGQGVPPAAAAGLSGPFDFSSMQSLLNVRPPTIRTHPNTIIISLVHADYPIDFHQLNMHLLGIINVLFWLYIIITYVSFIDTCTLTFLSEQYLLTSIK